MIVAAYHLGGMAVHGVVLFPPVAWEGAGLIQDLLRREVLSPHLLRLTLAGEGLAGLVSSGIPDEWVGLIVPGQTVPAVRTNHVEYEDGLPTDRLVADLDRRRQ